MIIEQLSPASVRTKRLQLYKDPVFLIAHEVVRPLLHDIDLTTLFVSARNFAAYLMANNITDEQLMFYELEEARREIRELGDYYMFLAVVFIKLCAIASSNPQADQASRALVGYCNEYEGFCALLKEMDSKERKLRRENRLAGLLGDELADLTPCEVGLEQAHEGVKAIVANSMVLTADSVEKTLLPLMATNEQYAHAFDVEVDCLKKRLGLKTSPQATQVTVKELVMEKKVEFEIGNVEAGAVGVQHYQSN